MAYHFFCRLVYLLRFLSTIFATCDSPIATISRYQCEKHSLDCGRSVLGKEGGRGDYRRSCVGAHIDESNAKFAPLFCLFLSELN